MKLIFNCIICLILFSSQLSAQPYSLELLDSPLKQKTIFPVIYAPLVPESKFDINIFNITKGYHNEGYSALFIDMIALTQQSEPYNFLHINLSSGNIKRIPVIKDNNPNLPQAGIGSIRTLNWGYDNKLYVGGEHLVVFDPYEDTAHDYGNPFYTGTSDYRFLNNMSLGLDSSIYGISNVSNGWVYVFRFSPFDKSIKVDSLYDPESSLGLGVQGDAIYTYIILGRDKSRVFSINRKTGVKSPLLLETDYPTRPTNTILRFNDTLSFTLDRNDTTFIFSNGNVLRVKPYNNGGDIFHVSNYPSPVPSDTVSYPLVGYNELTDSIYWKFKNSSTEYRLKIYPKKKTVNTNQLFEYSPGKLIVSGNLYSFYAKYNIATNTSQILTSTGSIYSTLLKDSLLYTNSYPSGKLTVINPELPVNIIRSSFTNDPVNENESFANPRRITQTYVQGLGAQVVNGMDFINDSLIVFCGEINSDGRRLGDGADMGVINIISKEVTRISDTILRYYVGLSSVFADNGFTYHSTKLYTYDGRYQSDKAVIIKHNIYDNKIEKIIKFISVDAGFLVKGISNQIVGYTNEVNKPIVYFFSEVSDEIYKIIEFDYTILKVKLGSDGYIWILTQGQSNNENNFYKIDPYSGDITHIYKFYASGSSNLNIFKDFIFVGNDVYLSGCTQIARIKNIITPIFQNNFSSLFDILNNLFKFYICL